MAIRSHKVKDSPEQLHMLQDRKIALEQGSGASKEVCGSTGRYQLWHADHHLDLLRALTPDWRARSAANPPPLPRTAKVSIILPFLVLSKACSSVPKLEASLDLTAMPSIPGARLRY